MKVVLEFTQFQLKNKVGISLMIQRPSQVNFLDNELTNKESGYTGGTDSQGEESEVFIPWSHGINKIKQLGR